MTSTTSPVDGFQYITLAESAISAGDHDMASLAFEAAAMAFDRDGYPMCAGIARMRADVARDAR